LPILPEYPKSPVAINAPGLFVVYAKQHIDIKKPC
jgi:hypothetical protein